MSMPRGTGTSTSTRSGRIRMSISSASTTTCRCRTGATARIMPMRARACGRFTIWAISGPGSRAARGSTGTTPTRPCARSRRAYPSPMAPMASRGSGGGRTSAAGGRTATMSGGAASAPRRRRAGCRDQSPSGSPRSAAPPSTRGRTSPTSSSIRNPRNRSCRGFRAGSATTRSRCSICARWPNTGTIRRATPSRASMAGRWSRHRAPSSGPGTRGPFRSFRPTGICGATARTTRWGTGSRGG